MDLDVSVNLVSCLLFEKMGLRELKSIDIILYLAYRSIKVPRRVSGNVLIQFDKFFYPIDFIVMDNEGEDRIKLILLQ